MENNISLKILMPFVGDSVGGSHRSSIILYKTLRQNSLDVHILLHESHGPLAKLLSEEGIPYYFLPVKVLAGTTPGLLSIISGIIRNFRRFSKFIQSHKFDIIHGNDLRINLSWSVPSRISGAKFIWHQRTILSTSRLWKLIPYLCDHFISISAAVHSTIPSNLKENRSLIFNPFDIGAGENRLKSREALLEKCSISNDRFIIGYVGRLVDYKNIDFILYSLSVMIERGEHNIHCVIAGTGSDKYIKEIHNLVHELDISQQVTFMGFVSETDELIAGLDVLVAASSIDAFGRTLVEAMLQHTPVLAAAAGGHLEIVEDGVNGLLFSLDDQNDFPGKLVELLENPEKRERITATAYGQACDRYSSAAHADSIVLIYDKLLSY